MGVYSEMAADLRDNVQDRSPAIQDAAELASRRADDRQQAEEEQAKALLSQMQQNADDSPSPSNLKADKKAEEDRKRQEHEQAEAKRKAEWEARQRAKEEAEQAAWENAVAMSDDEVMAASMKRVGDDSERLTRRNMKQCVTEYIQTLCLEDVAFARNVMHPRKNMVNCFRYINRKALEFAKQEMEDNDVMVTIQTVTTETHSMESNPFVGCTMVVTGKVEPYTRSGINAKIESLGAVAGSSVTKKTDYLICGENAGSKLDKARALGIRVLSPGEFFQMIGE